MVFGIGKKKKEEFSEEFAAPSMGTDDMLSQLEAETSNLGMSPPPAHQPAAGGSGMGGTPLPPPPEEHPAPEEFDMPSGAPPLVKGEASAPVEGPPKEEPERSEKALSKHQVAKLPLFMRVEEYDKIVGELTVLVQSLKNMEDIMNKLTHLEKEETEEAQRWNQQLDRTKDQVRLLLREMPETGELKDALKEKVKIKKRQQVREDVEKLKQEVSGKKPGKREVQAMEIALPGEFEEQHKELMQNVGDVNDSIKQLHEEMRHLQLEFKMLNSLTQLRTAKTAEKIKGSAAAAPKKKAKPKPKDVKSPWEE